VGSAFRAAALLGGVPHEIGTAFANYEL